MNEATSGIGKLMITAGVILIVAGILLLFSSKILFIGKLPGDIFMKKGNFTLSFPIVSSIVISIVLALIFFLISRFKQ